MDDPRLRRAVAEVDLSAIRHNVRQARRAVGEGRNVLAVVKADAYGHGAVPVAQAALEAGASMLGVADAAEGAELRDAGIGCPIVMLGVLLEREIESVVRHQLSPTVTPPALIEPLDREAVKQDEALGVHVMVDTGMTRAGLPPADVPGVLKQIRESKKLRLAGLATHFASAEDPAKGFALEQLERFRKLLDTIGDRLPDGVLLHTANSAAIFALPEAHFDVVRQGLTLYGMYPDDSLREQVELRPALSLKASIAYLRSVPGGTPVGYGSTYVTSGPTTTAAVPLGYNDGYCRAYSNKAQALVSGRRVPVVGRVSMDCITLDVTAAPEAAVGDTVTLIGRDGQEAVAAEELAEIRGSIPYEVTCAIGRRVPRVYVDTDQEPES